MLDIEAELAKLSTGWTLKNNKELHKEFIFKGFLKTMSFVNALAWQANQVMHHPDMEVSFNKCIVKITTHDAGNILTDKDFLLATRIDELEA